jgi:hypothetical protein
VKPPPALAIFLLLKLAPGTPGSLIGDVQEEYASGRSVGWVWRQVLRAVTVATACQMHAHPWETVRATVAGWAFLWIFFEYVFPLLVSPAEWLFVRGIADIRLWWPDITALLIYLIAPLACATAGWIVARFHRRESVLIFVVTVLSWNFGHFIAAIGKGSTAQVIQAVFLSVLVFPASVVVGGLCATRPADVLPAVDTGVHLT